MGADIADTIQKLFDDCYIQDPILNNILGQLHRGQTWSKQLSLANCQEDDNGHLSYQKHIYVPNDIPLKLWLIKFHKAPVAGHLGQSKTLELLVRQYYWPRMYKDID